MRQQGYLPRGQFACSHRSGFTLLELLVVIVAVVVLIALLIPGI